MHCTADKAKVKALQHPMAYGDAKQRLQITFGKSGALKYTGNLDVAKIWERVLRRAHLPILYSKGFNTRPRIQLSTALALGITSECEMLDVFLREETSLDGLAERLLQVSPTGLDIIEIENVPLDDPALQTRVDSSEYRIVFMDHVDSAELQAKIAALLATDKLVRVKVRGSKKSVVDLRPLIYNLHIDDAGHLIAHLAAGDHGNFRPDELLHELGLDALPHSIHRFRLHLRK